MQKNRGEEESEMEGMKRNAKRRETDHWSYTFAHDHLHRTWLFSGLEHSEWFLVIERTSLQIWLFISTAIATKVYSVSVLRTRRWLGT